MSMVEPGYLDEIANVANNGCDYSLDLLNILDFPEESLEGDDSVSDWDANMLQCLGPIPSDALMGFSPLRQTNVDDNGTLRAALKSKAFVDNPGVALLYPTSRYFEVPQSRLFQMQSPVSVLESSGPDQPGLVKTASLKSDVAIPVRTRSKRARPAINPWTLIPPISSTSFAHKKTLTGKKRRERRMYDASEAVTSEQQCSNKVKKCAHCEITKTPQWREGPTGPKTLCNACGVRYRSGRLFPEYRPAASPTFVPTIHSNSHRKVVEMRRKAIQEADPTVGDSCKKAAERLVHF